MRYFVLILMGVFGTLLSGSFVTGLNIAGIQVDIVLLMVISLALVDKTTMPILFAACAGLFMDILYSTVLGVYAFSYTMVAAAVLMLFRKTIRFNILSLFLAGAGGYLLKEIIMGTLVYILGGRFNTALMMVRYILPAAALSGVLLLLAYWLMLQLFRVSWMKPRRGRSMDEL